MRLFVAFRVPEDSLKKVQGEFNFDGLKLVREFHCTLKFLGEVNEEDVEMIREKLRGVRFVAFEAGFSDVGAFPNADYTRVVWVGLEPVDKICELQREVEKSLAGMFEKEERFKPHVTIARVKFVKDKRMLKQKLESKINVEGKFKVDRVLLMKSELRRDGPVYEVVEEYMLNM